MESNEQRYQLLHTNSCLVCMKIIFFISRWIFSVKHVLDFAGFGYIRLHQFDSNINRKWLSQNIKQCYCDMHIQEWDNFLERSPKAIMYRLFKTEHIYEPYLNILSLKNRLCNHRLPIETGRWLNIPRGEGICIMCNQGCIGDYFNDLRKRYLSTYYCKHPSVIKMNQLFNKHSKVVLINICQYLKQCFKRMTWTVNLHV